MKMKKLITFALAAALAIGTFGFSVPVNAVGYTNTTDYTITIPATLEVANAGWNETSGITAKRIDDVESESKYYQFDSSKKLTVTAASANSWKLVSGENNVGYNLATATGDYSSEATPASWEFSADELNAEGGKTKPMGIIVEDYTSKPAGTYQDVVTFTASVENAVVTPKTYPSLKTGDILHVGDIVTSADSQSGYSFRDYGASFPKNYSFKLVRADISISGVSYAKVTESDTGAYYIFLDLSENEGSRYRNFCLSNVETQEELDDRTGKVIFKATETSDGLEVTVENGNKISFSVHEP